MHMGGKTVLVTGGNSGVGKAAAAVLAGMGARVVITSRDPERGCRAADEIERTSGHVVECEQLDLASARSILDLAERFCSVHDRLHVLVNNAGVILSRRTETAEGIETTFGVNHLGHFLLTDKLLPLLRASAPSRIVNVSSEAHRRAFRGIDFDDLQRMRGYWGLQVYAESKLANLLFTRELARRLAGTGVTVNAAHPGLVASGFALDGDSPGVIEWFYRAVRPLMSTPEKGARAIVRAASAPDLEGVSGSYFSARGTVRPSRAARDDEAARRLWEISETLTARITGDDPRVASSA